MPRSSATPHSITKGARKLLCPSTLTPHPLQTWKWALLIVLLILPLIALTHLAAQHDPIVIFGGALALSTLTYLISAHDKKKAQLGQWRTPESTLHLWEAAGGWPGSYVAQNRFRHKVTKLSYQVTFWLIVVAHEAIAYDFLQNWRYWKHLQSLALSL